MYLKAKLAALGAVLLSVLFFFVRFQAVKNQRDKAERKANTLEARAIQQEVQKQIKRKEEEKLVSRKAEIVKELKKDEKDFKGLSNLNDSNDW